MSLWHQLEFEGCVDVFQLARLYHYSRCGNCSFRICLDFWMVPFWISFIYIYLLSLASIYLFIPIQQNFHFHLDNICLFLRIFGISFPSWYHTSPILEWWILTKSHLSDLGFGGARTITFSSTAHSKLTLPTMAPPFQGGDLFIITNTNVDTNPNTITNTVIPPAFRGGHLFTIINTNVDTDRNMYNNTNVHG